MKKIVTPAPAIIFIGLLFMTACVSAPVQNPEKFIFYEDLTYSSGPDWSLELDLAVPDIPGANHPLMVYLFCFSSVCVKFSTDSIYYLLPLYFHVPALHESI